MAKFNKQKTVNSQKTINVAGGVAYKESSKLELVSVLLTSFAQNKFYEREEKTNQRLVDLIEKNHPEFVAKSAIYARNEFGMRSITHITAAELAKFVSSQPWAKSFYNKIIHRPDDMTEILAYYMNKKGNKITNSMKKGFGEAFTKFDAYQLGKYRGEDKDFKLVDLANLVHPIPVQGDKFMVDVNRQDYIDIYKKKLEVAKKKKNNEKVIDSLNGKLSWAKKQEGGETVKIHALEALVIDLLRSKGTWQAELSKAGQVADSEEEKNTLKRDVWVKQITERKIGYFALLRNLRNIVEQAPDMIDKAIEMLTDRKLIKNSLVLPFRFLVAYKELMDLVNTNSDYRKILVALNTATEIALDNVPKFAGRTLVVVDTSGSMTSYYLTIGYKKNPKFPGGLEPIKSKVTCADAGAQFAAAIAKKNGCDLMRFDDRAEYKFYNPADSLMTITNIYKFSSAGTNFNTIFQTANKAYDRIIILSDMQGWMGGGAPTQSFKNYCEKYNVNPHIYSFNLNDYGTLMFPENKICALAGFSDKIFDIMALLETDKNALIHKIEEVEL